jgi:serine/threonine protein kinase
MHKNKVTHRDLKPQNILLCDKTGDLSIKIADFGFSCIYDPKDGLDVTLGSPMYMAPELINKKVYNEKVDIWAIVVICYMLLSGEPPFPAETKAEMNDMITRKTPVYSSKAFKKVS